MDKYIKEYKILREIGRGSIGVVYRAINIESQKYYTIRVLSPAMASHTTAERFAREAEFMIRLKHNSLMEVHDFGVFEGQYYLIMELVEGETLQATIKKEGVLSIDESIRIITRAAEALVYLHEQGIVHRDIKPENIMISDDGRVKLMDYGLVQIAGLIKVPWEILTIDTAQYLSPEQIMDKGVDARTDMYSLGITFYEMLAGRPPFIGDTVQAVLQKNKENLPEPLRSLRPEVPAEIEKMILKAVAKDPGYRYARVQDFIDEINSYRGITKAPPSPAAVKAEPVARKKDRRVLFGVLGAGLILIIGLLALAGNGEWFRSLFAAAPWSREKEKELIAAAKLQLANIAKAEEHFNFAQQLYHNREVGRAIAEYKAAIKLREDYGAYYKELAMVYEDEGDVKKAIETWNLLLKKDNSGAFVEMAIRHLEGLRAQ